MSDTVASKDRTAPGLPKVRALMGGTHAMRAAGETYLPREPRESLKAWECRRDRTVLFNGYRKTVGDMAGKVFATPVTMKDFDAELETWAEDIDLLGRGLNNFAHQVFVDGLQAGISFILVDSPPRVDGETRASGARPYWVHIREEDFLGFRAEDRGGRMTLTQVRVREWDEQPKQGDEFAKEKIERVRVFDLIDGTVSVRVFERVASEEGSRWQEIPEKAQNTGLPEITIVPVYVYRTGFMQGDPPLEDLADINITHWQSSSDQRNILHVARVPILFAKGFREEFDEQGNSIEVSIKSVMASDHVDADVRWVEHSGNAISAGRDDLKDLEFQMQALGLQLLLEKGAGVTATGEIIDNAKMNSPLSMMADNLKDALEQAFAYMAMHAGKPESAVGEVVVNKDFGVGALTQVEAQALLTMVSTGMISKARAISEMTRRGMLDDDTDPQEEADRVLEESGPPMDQPSMFGAAE